MRFRNVLYPVFQALQALGICAVISAVLLGGYDFPELATIARMELALARAAVPWARGGGMECSLLSAGAAAPVSIGTGAPYWIGTELVACGAFAIGAKNPSGAKSAAFTVINSSPPLIEPVLGRISPLRIIASDERGAGFSLLLPSGVMHVDLPARAALEVSSLGLILTAAEEQAVARAVFVRDSGAVASQQNYEIASQKGSFEILHRNAGARVKIHAGQYAPISPPASAWAMPEMPEIPK